MLAFIPETDFADESPNGYFLRVAEENFLGSITTLLRPTGVRLKAQYSQWELQAIAEYHGLELPRLQRLASFPTLHGSLVTGAFMRKAAIAVCPECLRHADYIRQAWHHELFTACPTHRVLLIDQCPECDAPAELNRGAVARCRCGYALSEARGRPADLANLFISSVLLAEPGRPCVLSGLSDEPGVPADIDKFLVFLANLTLPTPQRKNAAISFQRALEINEACFALAEDLPNRFHAFVQNKVQAANRLKSSRFVHHLGPWYKELNATFASADYSSVRATVCRVMLEQADAPINRKMKYIAAELLGLKKTFTASEAARLLSSSPDRIVSLVKTGQLAGEIMSGAAVEFCVVDRSAVEAQQLAAKGLVAGKELLSLLNISRRVRERLLASGVLNRVPDSEKPLFAKGDYRVEDIQRLIDNLAEGCRHDASTSGVGLDDISGKRFSNQQLHELYRLIFSGQIKPVMRDTTIQGLAAFRFDYDELLGHLRLEPSLPELTITDLTKITRWKHETIKAWVDRGLLPARRELDEGKHRVFISVANLVTFLSRYVVAADAAERLGSRSIWLTKPLKIKGVLAQGAHATSEGSQRGLLLSADALINVASGRASDWARQPAPAWADPRTSLVDGRCGHARSLLETQP
ncbi:TniQ family protein [Pseudomonas vancouverensis]|uniref:TniQ family protein n=1 Tax=Pseudomonas vancouverensis TaxID=95300 RepID=UPI003D04519C